MVSHAVTKTISRSTETREHRCHFARIRSGIASKQLEFLRIHPKTVVRLARGGQFPSFRIGNRWRFRASDLDDWAHCELSSPHSLRRE